MTATALPDPPYPDPKPRYRVTVYPFKKWWVIEIAELKIHTQTRKQSKVEATARDHIAKHLKVPENSFTLSITELDE